ncbi:hypothetical protein E2K80_08950 [Rhodophyticola sp. CCM32]|uniref:T4SS efffector SepA family protein n=1 Tax=Rhodophyticola sp. CCM32 TaxID=2916397 RepID=UPI00107EF5AB|nr:hypothetical protein [Rhodophyticola sp. CCM32]QBY00837.1 hypothetical protein E2K80_08950 [Rhodophyticola sp. CCM32]
MKSVKISNEAYTYLQSLAVPFEDTTSTVLDKILDEHKEAYKPQLVSNLQLQSPTGVTMKFGVNDLPNVSFTDIISGSIIDQPVKKRYWNDVLEEIIVLAVSKSSKLDVEAALTLNTVDGEKSLNGYRFVPSAGFSFQGVDAVRACKNISSLSKAFSIPVTLELKWQEKPKAQFAGKTAILELP